MKKKSDKGSGSGPELGEVLAVLRIAAGWSREELTRAAGLRSPAIADYEEGLWMPGLSTVSRVLRVLGYPFAALDVARSCIGLLRMERGKPEKAV